MSQKRVIIIGAGPGGLTSAMILAKRGFHVTLLEKQDGVGGRNAEIRLGPYSFDTGPTFLHQKFTLDEVFAEAGRNVSDHLDITRLDPMTRLSWGDATLDTTCDLERMATNIEIAFPGHAEGYRRYMADHAIKMRKIYPCLQKPYHEVRQLLSTTLLKAAPYVVTGKSVVDALEQYFHDDRLKTAFTFQAKYLGMSPWRCPALFSILSYLEYKHGIYHVQGGLCKISEAMATVFQENGGHLRLSTAVKEVTFSPDGTTATGVLTTDGEHIPADDVIMNADYAHAATTLLNGQSRPVAELERKKYSCSTYMLYLGLDTLYPDEPHHHILFAEDYRKNVEEITSERVLSDDFCVYCRNASITDPHLAPPGHSGLYILVPVINTRHGFDWKTHAPAFRDKILTLIERRTGMKDLRSHIVAEHQITPEDWRDKYSIFLGATFNLAHTLDQMLYLRPRNRMAGYKNLYLVGGGTHPGSGLPTIYESGRITSNLICQRYGYSHPRIDLAPDDL